MPGAGVGVGHVPPQVVVGGEHRQAEAALERGAGRAEGGEGRRPLQGVGPRHPASPPYTGQQAGAWSWPWNGSNCGTADWSLLVTPLRHPIDRRASQQSSTNGLLPSWRSLCCNDCKDAFHLLVHCTLLQHK